MTVTIDQVVAMTLRHDSVREELGYILRDDLVLANPFLRRAVEFVDDFADKYQKLPAVGDYTMWLDTLEPGMQRDGTREALGRLLAVDTSGFHPEYFAAVARPALQEAAAQVARARMNELPRLEATTLSTFAARIERIMAPAEDRRRHSVWPTLRDFHQGLPGQNDGEAEELIPGLAWRGRHVMLAGLPKLGKSTFVGAGAVALTRGSIFLHRSKDEDSDDGDGRRAVLGRVLWLAMDEGAGDALPRLWDNGAFRLFVAVANPTTPASFLAAILADEEERPDLVVVDSLIEYTRRMTREMPGSGEASKWTPIVRGLTQLAHDHHVAIVTIHHSRKSDGEYRDSTEIAAAMDGILTMFEPGPKQDASIRRIRVEGRRSITRTGEFYSVRLVQCSTAILTPNGTQTIMRDKYVLEHSSGASSEESGPAVRNRLVAFVTANPGCSQDALLRGVGGDHGTLRLVIHGLVEEGLVKRQKNGRAYAYLPGDVEATVVGHIEPD